MTVVVWGLQVAEKPFLKSVTFKLIADKRVGITQWIYAGREMQSMLRETASAKGCEVEMGWPYLKS